MITQWLKNLRPPAWLQGAVETRALLFVNHVLQHEPQAIERLARMAERTVAVQWSDQTWHVRITRAGLFEWLTTPATPNVGDSGAPGPTADLRLQLGDAQPHQMVGALLAGKKPDIHIEGDVQLAAEMNWLASHVRWDVEDDLSRVVGDSVAHTLGQVARRVRDALRTFIQPHAPGASNAADTPDTPSTTTPHGAAP